MANRAKCLHVPQLRENRDAVISWAMLEGVDQYELDVCYDESFDEAAVGREWADLHVSEWSWQDIHNSEYGWEDLQALPSRGMTWQSIHVENPSWQEVEDSGLSWRDIVQLPLNHCCYRGPAERVPGPEQGWTWADVHAEDGSWANLELTWRELSCLPARGLSWQDLVEEELSWQEIHETVPSWRHLALKPSKGLSWGDMHAAQYTWQEIEATDFTWRTLRTATDRDDHLGWTVPIPLYKKSAAFRLRFRDGEEWSDYLTANPSAIEPVFHREGRKTWQATAGQTYLVQIDAQGITDFEGILLTLGYNRNVLQLVEPVLQTTGEWGMRYPAAPLIHSHRDGKLRFTCTRSIPKGREWSGMMLAVQFKAVQSGTAEITLG